MKKYLVEYTSGKYCKVCFVYANSTREAKEKSQKQNIYDITCISHFEPETINHYMYMIGTYNRKQLKK